MAKFNVIEKFCYEVEADTLEQAQGYFQEFMEAGESEELPAKFLDNQTDFFDDNWNEVN